MSEERTVLLVGGPSSGRQVRIYGDPMVIVVIDPLPDGAVTALVEEESLWPPEAIHISESRYGTLEAVDMALNWNERRIVPTVEVPTHEIAVMIAREKVKQCLTML